MSEGEENGSDGEKVEEGEEEDAENGMKRKRMVEMERK